MSLLAITKLLVLFTLYQLALPISSRANRLDNLKKLIDSGIFRNPPDSEPWNFEKASQVYVKPQEGLMEAAKTTTLPGQPDGADFDQYAEESPAGVKFSYSNPSSDYAKAGDNSTAHDSYTFLENWLDRFPEYKPVIFTLLERAMSIGNTWIDDNMGLKGVYEYLWTHALNSNETRAGLVKNCDFAAGKFSITCVEYLHRSDRQYGDLDMYNIYAALYLLLGPKSCLYDSVQIALHAKTHAMVLLQVGRYVVGYKGVVLATVRSAGHKVPIYQPERALTIIAAFLRGKLPPISQEQ